MSETKSALTAQPTSSTDADPAQVSLRGRFFANPTFHFETLRNAGYILSNCADLGEILETVKVIAEGDAQSWYTAWEATSDRVLALAERTQDSFSKRHRRHTQGMRCLHSRFNRRSHQTGRIDLGRHGGRAG